MLIKICGIKSLEEIEAINLLKPQYIGFVFAESKRKVTKYKAKELINSLHKDIKTVGVFRNNSLEEVIDIANYTKVDIIQLHGKEDNDFIDAVNEKTNSIIWKGFSIKNKDDIKIVNDFHVDTLIVDGSNPGSGKVCSWDILKDMPRDKQIILAGGLNEENVLDAIQKVAPDGIDISSGVEIVNEDGITKKDKVKMQRLIEKVRLNDIIDMR